MTRERRSHYEFGDPVAEQIAAEEHSDHYRAKARGERIHGISQRIVSELLARGLLGGSADTVRVVVFGVLCDALYGVAAIDIPTLRTGDEP